MNWIVYIAISSISLATNYKKEMQIQNHTNINALIAHRLLLSGEYKYVWVNKSCV